MRVLLNVPNISHKTYIYEAALSSVIENNEKAKLWLALRSLNYYHRPDTKELTMYTSESNIDSSFELPFVNRKKISSYEYESIIQDEKELFKYLEMTISSGKYIYAHFEEFYIPGLEPYNNYKHSHDFLAYGFDSDKKELYLLAYTKMKHFESISVSYYALQEAFKDNTDEHFFLECIPSESNWKFEIQDVYNVLCKYLYCTSNIEDVDFNINTHNSIIEYLVTGVTIDIRPFRFLYERKIMLNYIINELSKVNSFLLTNEDLYRFEQIERSANLIFKLAIKYKIKPTIELQDKIINKLKNLYLLEKESLNTVLTEIESSLGGDFLELL